LKSSDTTSTTHVFEPVLEEIAKKTGVDIDRLDISVTFFNVEDFVPKKYVTLDGKNLPTSWSPELKQDINMPPHEWHKFAEEAGQKLSASIVENAVREILEHDRK